MKKRKHGLPDDASEIERAVKRAQRLYTGTNAKGEVVSCLPKLLWNPTPGSGAEVLLWAAIGRKDGKRKPEFSRGQGNWPGTEHRDRRDEDDLAPESNATRRWRDKKAREEERERQTAIIRGPDGEDEHVRLDKGPLDPSSADPSDGSPNAPTESVDLYDARFEFKNYYAGDLYTGYLAKEQEMDAAWYAERDRQKRERWLARKRIDE
jgi:hypothetical protein